MGSGAIGSGQDSYPRKVHRTRVKRAVNSALRGYERADRAALRLASRAIPAKTRQHIQAQRELFGGDIHLAVPVGRERAVAIRIPDRLKHFRHAVLPVALLLTLFVALQANAAVTGYGGAFAVRATGDQAAYEAQTYNDSLYTSGTLQGSADFGASYGGTDVKASAGAGGTAYVSKATAGSYSWTRVFTDNIDHVNMADIYAGANGASGGEAVYLTGDFTGEINFAADFGGSDIKTAVGDQDGYITRINADGSYGWTYTFGAADSYAQPTSVTYDPSAAVVIVTGAFGADMQFGPSGPVRTAAASNGFVLWLDDNVTSATYARDYHLTSSANLHLDTAMTTASEVLIGGRFETDATFEMGGSPATAPGAGSDGFLLRLGLDGTYNDVQSFGGAGQDAVNDIQVAADGTAYVAGTMTANATFRDVGAVSVSASATESFVLQVSPSDTNTWVRVFGDDNTQTKIEGMSLGAEGTVYAVGTYNGSVDFGKGFGASDVQQSHGTTSAFLTTFSGAAYDATYTIGAEATDDPAGVVSSYAVAGDNSDELLYLVGRFTQTINFGLPFAESDAIASSGGTDAYTMAIVTREPRTLSGGDLQYFDGDTNLSSSGTQELAPVVTVKDDDDTYLAELTVDLAENREWTTTGDSDHVGHRSVIANLANQDGAGETYTFYVPKGAGDKAVAICPNATTLTEVTANCATRQTFVEGAGATTQNIAGTDYWVLASRSETSIGGISLAYPGIVLTPPAGGLSITEGANATFSVALQAAPTEDVVITPDIDVPGQLSGGAAMTFTTENWQTPQELVFLAVDDQFVDGPVDATLSWTIASADDNYNGAAEPAIVMQVLDDDEAGITWAPTSLLLSEANAAAPSELCIALTAEPTDTVTLALSSSDTSETTIATPLIIAPENWEAATNCIDVTPVDDNETDGAKNTTLSITSVTSDDAAFSGLSAGSLDTVIATVQDDDIAGFVFVASGTAETTESGGTIQVCVELTAEPLAAVTIPLSSSDTSEGILSATEFVVAPEDWNAGTNCITATGQDDDLLDGDMAYNVLTGDPTSSDTVWDTLGEADTTNPSLTNLDDDNAGITVSESNIAVVEGGATDTFQVNLQSQPAPGQEVHLAITPSSTQQLTAEPSTLTFTNATWAVPQTVTVTAVDDGLLEGAHSEYLTVSVLESSTDEAYLPLSDQTIEATITDNDTAQVTVLATSNADENGDNGAFTVSLDKQNNTSGAITVNYSVLGSSTAVAGTHYAALSGSVDIPVGQMSAVITVNVDGYSNELLQGDRSIQIELTSTNAANVTIGIANDASVLITDDETATVSLAAASGEEGGDNVVFTATLSRTNNTGSDMVFELAEAGGTASSGADYAAFDTESIAIADGASTGTLTVAVTDDELLEPNTESIIGGLSDFPLPPSVTLDDEDFAATTTIADNDQADVTIAASNAAEPATAGSFNVELSKTNETGTPITVTFSAGGTATSGTDFTTIAATVDIPDGENSASVTLTPIDDTDMEDTETVEITLNETSFGRASIGTPGSASATIADNEVASVAVTTPDDTTGEDGATGQVCFTLGSRPSADVTIALSSSDTSKVTVPSGATIERDNWNNPTCVTTTGQNDTPPAVTGAQDVTIVTGEITSTDSYYDALDGGNAADTIMHHADNDAPGVTVTSIDTVTSEDGAVAAHVRFSLTSEPTESVTISLSLDDGTEGSLVGESEVVITPEDWNTPANNELIIHGVDDDLTDGTVTYHLLTGDAASADSNYNIAGTSISDVALTNSDDDEANVAINPSSNVMAEGSTLTHTVTIASQPAPGKKVVITATPSNGQVNLGSGVGTAHTLTFTNADWGAKEIILTAVDDSLLEAGHGSIITYTIDESTDEQAYLDYEEELPGFTITITDNDTATAILSGANRNEGEESLPFTVTLSTTNNTGAPISFALDTTDGTATAGADYTALSGATISVPNGSTSGSTDVTIADDADLEGDETVGATISNSSLPAIDITSAQATATILDDENADAVVTATDADAAENASDSGEFTIALSRPNRTGAPITINYEVSGTATADTDFQALSGSVTILDNESSAIVSVITTANDEIVEGDENVVLTLVGPTNAQVNIDATPATVTIHDDDAYLWSIAKVQDGLENDGEGSPQNIQFVISTNKTNTTGSDMTVALSNPLTGSAASAQDYTAFGGIVTVPDGQSTAVVTVTVADDNLLEQSLESVDAVIAAPSSGTLHGTDIAAQATITDNDDATAVLSAAAANESDESGLIFTVTLSHQNATGAPIDFDFATLVSGSATSGVDFTAAADATISIAHGATAGTLAVEILDDAAMEGDETVDATVTGSSFVRAAITDADASATVHDDDEAEATVVANDANATENSNDVGEFTIALSTPNNTPGPITINYTIGGSAAADEDFVAINGSVEIPAGESSATVAVTTTLNDEVVEGSETVVLTLQSAGHALVTIDSTPATVTIADDDAYNWSIAKQSDGLEQGEQAITFRVSLSKTNTTGDDMTIALTDPLTGAATKSQDYLPFDGIVVIPDGENEAVVSVQVDDDALLESLEDLNAVLSSPSEGTISTAAASATIADNDTATATLSSMDGSEAGADITFTATLNKTNNTSAPITFALNSTGGTATANTDYAALNAVVISVPIGSTSASVTAETVDDTDMEGAETVTAALSGSSNVSTTITGSTATATIADNDAASASAVASTPVSPEDGSADGQITVQLSRINKTPSPITITYTASGTATSDSDYEALSGSIQIPVDAAAATIDVTALEDELAEGGETVILTLTSADHPLVSISGQSAATVTLVDNDSFSWSIIALQSGNENGNDAVFRVQLSQQNETDHSLTATLSDPTNGSAESGSDYTAFDTTVTIPSGASYADVTVPVLDDDLLERIETVGGTLSEPSEGDIAIDMATISISDNETAQLTVEATQPAAAENPAQNGQFTVSLGAANESDSPITINYTVDGTAVGGQDYAGLSGTANIPAGQDSTTIWVDMSGYDDATFEPSETVVATLASTDHSGVQIGAPASAMVTIQSNDAEPVSPEDSPASPVVAPSGPPAIFVPAPRQNSPEEPQQQTPVPLAPPIDQTAKDQDKDGIDDIAEAEAHNFGDGNGDGIPDNMQANVSSLVSAITQRPVTLAAMGECTDITSFTVVGENDLTKSDLTHRYPHGLVDYTVECSQAGQDTEVAVYYDEQLDGNFTWRKLAQPTLEFQAIDNAEPTLRAVGQGNVTVISYSITDGGSLDDDGKADGKILDPAGLASSIFQPRDLLWLAPVLVLASALIARAGVHHHREHKANRAKIAKF